MADAQLAQGLQVRLEKQVELVKFLCQAEIQRCCVTLKMAVLMKSRILCPHIAVPLSKDIICLHSLLLIGQIEPTTK